MNAGVQVFDPVLLHVRFYSGKAFTGTGFPPNTSAVPWQCYSTSGLYKSKVKVKVKFTLEQTTKAQRGSSTLPSTSALEGGWGGQRQAQAALHPGKKRVPIVQGAGWVPGPIRTSAENLAPRSPDRPARRVPLYRLRYAGPPAARIRLHINAIRKITS